MGFEKKTVSQDEMTVGTKAPANTVRMKFTGHFKGTTKIVELPIPLIANSQKLEEVLTFTRESNKQGPAFCDVPLEWAGALLDVGGRWQAVEDLTPELTAKIAAAKIMCDAKMDKFIADNELVDA